MTKDFTNLFQPTIVQRARSVGRTWPRCYGCPPHRRRIKRRESILGARTKTAAISQPASIDNGAGVVLSSLVLRARRDETIGSPGLTQRFRLRLPEGRLLENDHHDDS